MKSIRITSFILILLLLSACNDGAEMVDKSIAWTNDAELGVAAIIEGEITDLSGEFLDVENIPVTIPEGATNLEISTSGGTGDVDLYVRAGGRPDSVNFGCRSIGLDNEESCFYAEPEPGEYVITLFAMSDYEGVTLTLSFDDGAEAETFDIELIFSDTVTEAQKPLFEEAARRWESIVTVGVADIPNVVKPENECEREDAAFEGDIDDLVLFVDVEPIDGPSLVVANAGPCLIRNEGSLPLYATILFDSADIDSSTTPVVILHEMGHALGIGTQWEALNLVNYTEEDIDCIETPLYLGENARQVWQDLGGTGDVPVEEDGGPGAACGHWNEGDFDTELMTGFSENGTNEELSLLTVASLQDLGYAVDESQADAYTLPECAPDCSAIPSQPTELESLSAASTREVLLRPIGTVGANGEINKFED